MSVYGGYFGAGSGVMVLALLLLTVDRHLPRANALKNVILGVADIVAAVGFALFGPVDWAAAVPLAVGLLAGSLVGPSATRRVPAELLRVSVAWRDWDWRSGCGSCRTEGPWASTSPGCCARAGPSMIR